MEGLGGKTAERSEGVMLEERGVAVRYPTLSPPNPRSCRSRLDLFKATKLSAAAPQSLSWQREAGSNPATRPTEGAVGLAFVPRMAAGWAALAFAAVARAANGADFAGVVTIPEFGVRATKASIARHPIKLHHSLVKAVLLLVFVTRGAVHLAGRRLVSAYDARLRGCDACWAFVAWEASLTRSTAWQAFHRSIRATRARQWRFAALRTEVSLRAGART